MKDKSNSNRKIREPIREKNKSINFEEEIKTSKSNKKTTEKSNKDSSTPKYSKIESVSADDEVRNDTSTLSLLNIVFIILGILLFVFVIIFLISFLDPNSNSQSGVIGNESEQINVVEDVFNSSAQLNIVSIVNPNCEFCQVDSIEEDLRVLVSPLINESNITVQRFNHNSTLAQSIFREIDESELNYNFTPLFIVSNDIANLELFSEEEIQSLFVTNDKLNYYILSAQSVQIKYLNSQLETPNSTITLGNVNGVPITYMYDYNCIRCQVMSGSEEAIEMFKQDSRISQNYTAPILELLKAVESVENRNDTSFNLKMIPAPTSPQSEPAHRAIYCANEQDLFTLMHQSLVQINTTSLNSSEYSELLTQLGGNAEEFNNCFNSEETNNYINDTREFLTDNEITSLPALIVGNYPLLDLVDNSIVSMLVESELPNFIEEFEFNESIRNESFNEEALNNVSMN